MPIKVVVFKSDEDINIVGMTDQLKKNHGINIEDVTKQVTKYYRKAEELDALEVAGVDNWQWYGEHCKDFDGNHVDFDELELPW